MFSGTYIEQRIKKLDILRDASLDPYDNIVSRTICNIGFVKRYEESLNSENTKDENSIESVVGRIKFIRVMGKAVFLKIEDNSGLLQVYFSKDRIGEDSFELMKKTIEVGDIINASGFPFLTKTGELSLNASSIKILTKSIIPLPEKFHGLTDIELRYRQRYLDLIMNTEVKNTFKLRSKIVSLVRRYFEDAGFLEVETPMMHPIPGGANAKPFITYHNALDVNRYLRIAPELYLKRLIVGGFEKIFEINRNFRNEGMDHSHNPEFTTIEFYYAYKTYEDLIPFVKNLLIFLLDSLQLGHILNYGEAKINFDNFTTITYKDSLIKIGKIPADVVNDESKLRSFLKSQKVENADSLSYGHLQSEAFDLFVEEKLIDPTFVIDYPIEISPLSRRSNRDANIADRFELFIGGNEIANAFSELNDPIDQFERFKSQVALKDAGDDEALHMDEDFVYALGCGMAPTAGCGIGIDRLVMLLTDNRIIKDVILFPAMRPIKSSTTEEE